MEATQMDDISIHKHIEDLVAEEGRLLHAHEQEGLADAEHQRMREWRSRLTAGTCCASDARAAW
jgi:hypothetical protein